MSGSFIAGVDIGGSHITVALVDVEKRVVVEQTKKRALINSQGAAAFIIKSWAQAIRESYAVLGLSPFKLAIAMPGPFDYAEGISLMQDQNKYDALYGLNIKEMLSAELGILPGAISFANDAACFLQGELFSGVAKGKVPAFGLTLGTGFGSARALGEYAEDGNLWCAPFKQGIAEDYLSGRWLVAAYYELTGKKVKDVKALIEEGLSEGQKVFETFGRNLTLFLTPYLLKEKTRVVVLGGSIAQSFSLFYPAMQQQLEANNIQVEVLQSLLGENAAMLGAVSYSLRPAGVLNNSL